MIAECNVCNAFFSRLERHHCPLCGMVPTDRHVCVVCIGGLTGDFTVELENLDGVES